MNSHLTLKSWTLGAALLGAAGAALAASSAAPEIARVEAIYEQAQQAGGPAAAPVEMQSAEHHLNEARETANQGHADAAARLAEEAEADAQLALAKAREQTAQASARQVQQALTALRMEANQNVSQAPAGMTSGMGAGATTPLPAGSGGLNR